MSDPAVEAGADSSQSVRGEQPNETQTLPENGKAEASFEADAVLLGSREIARRALTEITDAQTIGADEGYEVHEAHVLTLFFECRLAGYPGWRWAATVARVDEDSPVTVLEVELLPGEGAVTAPEWVPWSVRLAQYREVQQRQAADEAAAAEEAAGELADEDNVDPEEDLLNNDFSDFEDEIDGIELSESDNDDDSDEDGSDDDDDGDEDDDGFADLDEHDLNDDDDEEVDFEDDEEE